jgi:hypothetical protein
MLAEFLDALFMKSGCSRAQFPAGVATKVFDFHLPQGFDGE